MGDSTMPSTNGDLRPSDRLGRVPARRLAEYDLSVSQVDALEALLTGATVVEAAEQAGVTPRTVHRWRKRDADFQAAEDGLRRGMRERTYDRLLAAADRAADVVFESVRSGDTQAAFRLLRGLGMLNGQARELGSAEPDVRRLDQAIASRQRRDFLEAFRELYGPEESADAPPLLSLVADVAVETLREEPGETTDAELLEEVMEEAVEAGVFEEKPGPTSRDGDGAD